MVAAGIKLLLLARSTAAETAADGAVIDLLRGDARVQERRLHDQERVLKAAQAWMQQACRPGLPPPPAP